MDSANALIIMGILFCGAGASSSTAARPIVLASIVLIAFVIIFLDDARGGRIITQERSFFGVLRTRVIDDRDDPAVPPLRILMHGTTIHGAQLATPELDAPAADLLSIRAPRWAKRSSRA